MQHGPSQTGLLVRPTTYRPKYFRRKNLSGRARYGRAAPAMMSDLTFSIRPSPLVSKIEFLPLGAIKSFSSFLSPLSHFVRERSRVGGGEDKKMEEVVEGLFSWTADRVKGFKSGSTYANYAPTAYYRPYLHIGTSRCTSLVVTPVTSMCLFRQE